jgi:hypothetical protein
MEKYSGFLMVLDEVRRGWDVQFRLDERELNRFSDALSAADWKFKKIEICLLSLDGENISHVALARRGARVVTGKYRVDFFDIEPLEPVVSIETLEALIPSGLRQHFNKASTGQGGRVPPQTWQHLLSALKQMNPYCLEQIAAMEKKRLDAEKMYRGANAVVLSQERDACFLAMDLFGLEKHSRDSMMNESNLSESYSKSDSEVPFLKGLHSTIMLEDNMIDHDTTVFGDWEFIKRTQMGAKVFRRLNQQLIIINVNRTPLESVLGVDLLYYHHLYQSYVLVQYKRLTKEDGATTASYRPLDKSYLSELQSMRSLEQLFLKSHASLNDYRLNFGPFYFKLCPAENFQPYETDLIKGMYLPFDYWECLVKDNCVKGPRGGIAISRDNVGRYLNNTQFVQLVQSGWIGSSADDTKTITQIIRTLLESNHSVFLASSYDIKDDS